MYLSQQLLNDLPLLYDKLPVTVLFLLCPAFLVLLRLEHDFVLEQSVQRVLVPLPHLGRDVRGAVGAVQHTGGGGAVWSVRGTVQLDSSIH